MSIKMSNTELFKRYYLEYDASFTSNNYSAKGLPKNTAYANSLITYFRLVYRFFKIHNIS